MNEAKQDSGKIKKMRSNSVTKIELKNLEIPLISQNPKKFPDRNHRSNSMLVLPDFGVLGYSPILKNGNLEDDVAGKNIKNFIKKKNKRKK